MKNWLEERANYAADYDNAFIEYENTTPSYHDVFSQWFGINMAEKMLSDDINLGSCWAISGSSGHATIVLSSIIIP